MSSEEKKDTENPAPPPTVPEDPELQKQGQPPPGEGPTAFPPPSPRPNGGEGGGGEEGAPDKDVDHEQGSIQDEASIGEDSLASDVGADKTGVSFDFESSIEDAVVLVPGDEGDKVLGPVPITEREATEEEDAAAVKIQGMVRSKQARDRVREKVRGSLHETADAYARSPTRPPAAPPCSVEGSLSRCSTPRTTSISTSIR